MKGTYLIDKIEASVLVIASDTGNSPIKLLSVNQYASQFLGIQREDFLTVAKVLLPEGEGSKLAEQGMLQIEGGELFCAPPYAYEAFADTFEGQECWVLIGEFKSPNKEVDKGEEYTLMEEAIRHSISDAVIITDTELQIESWNQAACQLYGWKGKDVKGKHIGEVIPTTYVHEKREEVLRHFEKNGSWEGEVIQIDANGKEVHIHAAVDKVLGSQGETLGVIAVNRNVSGRREIEKALEVSETRLRLAGKASYDLIYEWEPHTGVLTWFGDIDGMLGFPQGAISNTITAWLERIHPEDRVKMEAAVEYHTTHDDPIDDVYRIMHADGHYLHWKDDALAVVEDGKIVRFVGVCTDITEKTLAQNRLKERQKLLTTIAENFPRAYLSVIYPDLTVGYTNGQEFKLGNIDPEQFIGLTVKQVFTPFGEDTVSRVEEAYLKTFTGEAQVLELQLGEEYQQVNTVPIEGENGKINRILAVVRNISDTKKREIKLKESEEKFSKAFMFHPVPMEIINVDTGERVEFNEAFVRLLGYSREKMEKASMYDLDLWVDKSRRTIAMETLNTYGEIQDFPLSLRTRKGTIRHLLVSAAMLDIEPGNLAIVSLVDITLRKMAEESLRASESQLRTLVETLPDLFWLKDPQGVYLACNPRFCELYDTDEASLLGKTDWDFVPEETAQFFRRHDLLAIEAGKPRKNEELLEFLSDGHKELVETVKTPVYTQDGSLIGVMGIARDITERVAQLEMLERQNSALKNISWMQSHEVRAPLANIMGLVSLMEGETKPSAAEQEFIYEEVINAAHKLDEIIQRIIHETQEHLWSIGENGTEAQAEPK